MKHNFAQKLNFKHKLCGQFLYKLNGFAAIKVTDSVIIERKTELNIFIPFGKNAFSLINFYFILFFICKNEIK